MSRAVHTRRVFVTGLASALAAPALARGIGPSDVSRLQVRKKDRKIDLIGHGRVLKSYDMRLGSEPVGTKRFRGDGRTPEGAFVIDRRNPQSRYHLSLGISYPRPRDRFYASSRGKSAGGDIFIHGQPNGLRTTLPHDWTRGCMAVSNEDMEEIWRLCGVGTRVNIYP